MKNREIVKPEEKEKKAQPNNSQELSFLTSIAKTNI